MLNHQLHEPEPAWVASVDPVAHDIAFGLFLAEHDGQRIAVTFEQYGVEVNVHGTLRLTLAATYYIGDRLFDLTVGPGHADYEGFPIRWAALTE